MNFNVPKQLKNLLLPGRVCIVSKPVNNVGAFICGCYVQMSRLLERMLLFVYTSDKL